MSLSLAEYAEAKGLPPGFLQALGVHEEATRTGPRVVIPYYDESGAETLTRYRGALNGNRFSWPRGTKTDLYGLNRLKAAREAHYIIVVEGESDCHTLWHSGFHAIGVPGASNWVEERTLPA